jgi:hypothetical protein
MPCFIQYYKIALESSKSKVERFLKQILVWQHQKNRVKNSLKATGNKVTLDGRKKLAGTVA